MCVHTAYNLNVTCHTNFNRTKAIQHRRWREHKASKHVWTQKGLSEEGRLEEW